VHSFNKSISLAALAEIEELFSLLYGDSYNNSNSHALTLQLPFRAPLLGSTFFVIRYGDGRRRQRAWCGSLSSLSSGTAARRRRRRRNVLDIYWYSHRSSCSSSSQCCCRRRRQWPFLVQQQRRIVLCIWRLRPRRRRRRTIMPSFPSTSARWTNGGSVRLVRGPITLVASLHHVPGLAGSVLTTGH
jgi:hypothetical protein